jgi:DNA-binding response OmpR family regulator
MGGKATILIVEDDVASAEMLAEMFCMADYSVETVSTVEQATSAMNARRYGAALLDLTLPGTTMDELCGQLEKVPVKPPIIIFSARMPVDLQAAGKQLGAAAVLQKPARMEVLLSTMARVLGHAA